MVYLLYTGIAFILTYLLLTILIASIAYIKMFKPKAHTLEHTKNVVLSDGDVEATLFDLPWELARIDNPRRNSYIELSMLPGKVGKVVGTIILVHGINWTRYGMFKYVRPFMERGWNLVAFDIPGHGASPAGSIPSPAFGFEEKHDLGLVVDWVRSHFGPRLPLVLLGESMGAATVLQYAPLGAPLGSQKKDWKIDAIIADCPYASAEEELIARLTALRLPRFIYYPASVLVSKLLFLFRGYSLKQISPESSILESEVPILFIHGNEDLYVPTRMSVQMAEVRIKAIREATELLLVQNARHGKSVLVDPQLWFSTTFGFLEKNIHSLKN